MRTFIFFALLAPSLIPASFAREDIDFFQIQGDTQDERCEVKRAGTEKVVGRFSIYSRKQDYQAWQVNHDRGTLGQALVSQEASQEEPNAFDTTDLYKTAYNKWSMRAEISGRRFSLVSEKSAEGAPRSEQTELSLEGGNCGYLTLEYEPNDPSRLKAWNRVIDELIALLILEGAVPDPRN